jgi:hypothetical protein
MNVTSLRMSVTNKNSPTVLLPLHPVINPCVILSVLAKIGHINQAHTFPKTKRVLYQNSYEPESSVAQQRAGSGLFLCRLLFATVPLCDNSIWLPLHCSVYPALPGPNGCQPTTEINELRGRIKQKIEKMVPSCHDIYRYNTNTPNLLSIRYAVPVAYKSWYQHKNRRKDSVWRGHTERVD